MRTHLFTIAIDLYDNWRRLSGAFEGAVCFEKVLRQRFGVEAWQCVSLANEQASAAKIEEILISYTPDGNRSLDDQDQLIIYFAGHGAFQEITGKSFLIPVEGARRATNTWMSYDFFRDYFRAISARHILLIADACFSGGIFRADDTAHPETRHYAERVFTKPSRYALTSGGIEPVDDAKFSGQSVFSWALTGYLERAQEPFILAQTLAQEMLSLVTANASQTPEFGWLPNCGHQGGQTVLFQGGTVPPSWAVPHQRLSKAAGADHPQLPEFSEGPLQFVGANRVLEKLDSLLSVETPIRLLVTGMGGIGKTACVLDALKNASAKLDRPAVYLDAGIADGDSAPVLASLLSQLDPSFEIGSRTETEVASRWRCQTQAGDFFLILDNIRDDEQWRAIRPPASCPVIAISRHRLTGFAHVISVQLLEPDVGAALACRIANLSEADRITDAQAVALHRACDGLPLGIEVAAAALDQNPFLDADRFITTLSAVEQNLPHLEDWEKRVQARLRISLKWLSDDQRNSWALLAIFAAPFQKGALAALWNTEHPDLVLHPLLVRHLVMPQPRTLPTGAKILRFRLHDLLRPLAFELLPKIGNVYLEDVHRRLNRYYSEILVSLGALARKPVRIDLRDHFALITQDIENIRTGIEFAQADHDWESAEALVAYALDETLSDRLPSDEHLALVDKALSTVERWKNQRPEASEKYRQKLLIEKGLALRALSRAAEAESTWREGIEAAEKAGSKSNIAAFWGNLGSLLLHEQNRTEEALRAFRTALNQLDESSSKRERSALLNNCGNAFLRLGNLQGAKDAYWISQSLDEEIGNLSGVAVSKGNLANIAIFEGDYAGALELAEAAAATERDLGLEQAEAQSLQIAGKAAFLANDFEKAEVHFQSALLKHEKFGHLVSVTKARANLAAVSYHNGDAEGAFQQARACAKTAHRRGHFPEAAGAIRTMATILMDQGRLPRAFKMMRCAIALHTASHNRAEMIEDVLALAGLFLSDRQPSVADRYVRQAEVWAQEHGEAHHIRLCHELRNMVAKAMDES